MQLLPDLCLSWPRGGTSREGGRGREKQAAGCTEEGEGGTEREQGAQGNRESRMHRGGREGNREQGAQRRERGEQTAGCTEEITGTVPAFTEFPAVRWSHPFWPPGGNGLPLAGLRCLQSSWFPHPCSNLLSVISSLESLNCIVSCQTLLTHWNTVGSPQGLIITTLKGSGLNGGAQRCIWPHMTLLLGCNFETSAGLSESK